MQIFFAPPNHGGSKIRQFSSGKSRRISQKQKCHPWEYPVNACVTDEYILGPTIFLLYIIGLPIDVICNTAIYGDDTTLYCKVGFVGAPRVSFWTCIWPKKNKGLRHEMACWFSCRKILTCFVLPFEVLQCYWCGNWWIRFGWKVIF